MAVFTSQQSVYECDLRYAEVVGMHWVPDGPENIPECCAKKHNKSSFSYLFCLDVCQLCCKKLILTLKCPDPKPKPPSRPVTDVRDHPVVTPGDTGLSFSTSAYGLDLPIVFGSDKLNGNVFWASPVRKVLIDAENHYSVVDFAFGLCEGSINGVVRMWLGDKLVLDNSANVSGNVVQPNADGFISGYQIDLTDPESPISSLIAPARRQTKISVFAGSETQLPEGVMVTRDGFDNVPAYRGTAYVLFENFIVASGSIPNIFVEVTSNVTNNLPRLYGAQRTSPATFTGPIGDYVATDVSFDQTYQASRHTTGSPQPTGWTVFDNNDYENLSESEIRNTYGVAPRYNVTRLLPLTGYLMMSEDSGSAGILRVWNPFAQRFVDDWGPGGGVSGHNLTTGMSVLQRGSIAFASVDPITGLPIDVYMGFGSVNSSLGFATVNSTGLINMVSVLNGVLPRQDGQAVFFQTNTSLNALHPTFVDGGSTDGAHVMLCVAQQNELSTVYICRVTVHSATVSLSSPSYVQMSALSTADLIGSGFGHTAALMLIDPKDNMLVIFMTSSSPHGPIVFKYNPFNGEIVWKTQATDFVRGQGSDQAYLVSSTYCWIGAQGIYRLDMQAGKVETLASSLINQDLPTPAGGAQFYNGAENTIVYGSESVSKQLVKVYIDRVARTAIGLGTVIRLLLERVGLLRSDFNVTDLVSLTLTGYTVKKRQSLRTSFGELGQAFRFDIIESNGRIKYQSRGQAAVDTIEPKHLGDVEDLGWWKAEEQNDLARLRKISLTYRDIDREYRDNVQSVILPPYGTSSVDADASIDVRVPIVLEANTAKTLAEILLYSKQVYDTTYRFKLPPEFMHLDPGDVIDVEPVEGEEPIQVRIRKTSIGADFSVMVQAALEDDDIYNDQVNLFGAVGNYNDSSFPAVPPRIETLVIEAPFFNATQAQATASTHYLHLVFLNVKANAVVSTDATVYLDGQATGYTVPKPLNFPTWGYVITPPDIKTDYFGTDYTSEVVVRVMSTDGHAIESVTYDTMLQNSSVNLCYAGGELWQFQTATNNMDGTWTFTVLHRGKFGTEPAVMAGNVGDKWVLIGDATGAIDTGAIRTIEIPAADPIHVAQLFLRSSNPLQPAPIEVFVAKNLHAWAPADMSLTWSGNDAVVSWQRRVRYDGEWADDGSEQLTVDQIDESYVIYFHDDPNTFKPSVPETYLRKVELTTTSYTYTQTMQTADGYDGTTTDLYATVYQQGGTEGNRYGMTRTKLLEAR